jgi:hypothetical protein
MWDAGRVQWVIGDPLPPIPSTAVQHHRFILERNSAMHPHCPPQTIAAMAPSAIPQHPQRNVSHIVYQAATLAAILLSLFSF